MFTDRFIKVPVEIVKQANEDLGTKEESLCEEIMRINPFEITTYRRHFDDDGVYDNCVTVEFKTSNSLVALLSMDEFEKLLNDFYKK